jgi:hypothetical protein
MNRSTWRLYAVFLFVHPLLYAQARPSVDTFKQVLTQHLVQLHRDGFPQRHVLFQNVYPGGGGSGTYEFQVSLLIHDYGPGYPRNRYFGSTCVGRLDGTFTMMVNSNTHQWTVEGRMTPGLENTTCKNNPSDGVSSIPLASLSGSEAQPGAPAAPVGGQTPAGAIPDGSYECWANGQARMLMNFQVTGGNSYTGQGRAGSYAMDGTGRVTFRGGNLDGVMPPGFYARYHTPGGRSTVSFMSPRGAESGFCQKVR